MSSEKPGEKVSYVGVIAYASTGLAGAGIGAASKISVQIGAVLGLLLGVVLNTLMARKSSKET